MGKAAVKAAPGVALALATRDDAGKGALLCQAPDAGKGPLKANEWLKDALAVAGGKGGGKADSAQGQVPDASKLDDVIAAAQQFAESKLQACHGPWLMPHDQDKSAPS